MQQAGAKKHPLRVQSLRQYPAQCLKNLLNSKIIQAFEFVDQIDIIKIKKIRTHRKLKILCNLVIKCHIAKYLVIFMI